HGGFESAEALREQHGPLPDKLTVTTGGDGFHVYFRHPGGRVPNSTSKVAPGVDVRGDGGFVVAPPSVHASGKSYAWRHGGNDDPQPLPAWLQTLLVAPPERCTGSSELPRTQRPTAGERWLDEALV